MREVALNGWVPSYPQYLGAVAAAQRVAGVTNLHNHLEVVPPIGSDRDNATLITAANNALALDVTVPDGVEATASNGSRRLIGTVRYGFERAAAEHAVAGLTGVRNIKDEIEIEIASTRTRSTSHSMFRTHHYAPIADDSEVVMTTNDTVTLNGPRPHLAWTRRCTRCRLDGAQSVQCPRRPLRHGLVR